MAYLSKIVNGQVVQTHVPELLTTAIPINSLGGCKDHPLRTGQWELTDSHLVQKLLLNKSGTGRLLQDHILALQQVSNLRKRSQQAKVINRGLLGDGEYRKGLSWLGSDKIETAVAVTCPAEEVSRLMNDLNQFVARDDLNLVVQSIIAFTQLLMIHPFKDGNGRVARLLLYKDLHQAGLASELALSITRLPLKNPYAFRYQLIALRQTSDWPAYLRFWSGVLTVPVVKDGGGHDVE